MERTDALGARPLYRQVRDVLVRRIADGTWSAGQGIPSEPDLAADLGVSQGTVRKALDELTAENLVVRRQGRGTFVARHDDARILFQFFKLVPDEGERRFPESRVVTVEEERADPGACRALGLQPADAVVAIERVRFLSDKPAIAERIVVPCALFPGIGAGELPNNLYDLYSTAFGVTIARATERLKAVPAGRRHAELLGVSEGAPLLEIDRVAFAIDGRPAEWRVSLCTTDTIHYASDLR
jgi:GntR family transcriptional regulator